MSQSSFSGKNLVIGMLSMAAAYVFVSDNDYNESSAPKTGSDHSDMMQKCRDVEQDYTSRVSVPCIR